MEIHQLNLFNDVLIEPRQLELFVYPAPPPKPGQLELFPSAKYKSKRSRNNALSESELQHWKSQILNYQNKTRTSLPIEQTTLFYLPSSHYDFDKIDPLMLELKSIALYQKLINYPKKSCLYFVVDSVANIILYLGVILRSGKSRQKEHGFKEYIESYQSSHQEYGLQTAIKIGYMSDIPQRKEAIQELKLYLIYKWRSPFNQENWTKWGQPFGKDCI